MPPATAPASLVEDIIQTVRAAGNPVRMFVHGAPLNALTTLARFAENSVASTALDWVVSLDQKNDSEKERLLGADYTLLQRLVDQGYLTRLPNLVDGSLHRANNLATPLLNNIVIASNRVGDIREVAPDASVSNETKPRMYRRWAVLLHEAAHCQSTYTANPFQPSEGDLPEKAVDAINRWSVGTIVANPQLRQCLEEGFADCYGLMMLLKASNFDPEALKVARNIQSGRRATREEQETKWSAGVPKHEMPHTLGVHYTDMALDRVLANVDQWKTIPAEDLAKQAFIYASDGFLELINAKRVNADGFPVGQARRRLLADIRVENMCMQGVCLPAAAQYTNQTLPDWQQQQLHEHPVGAIILKAAAEAAEHPRASWHEGPAAQQMPTFIGAKRPAGAVPGSSFEVLTQSRQLSDLANHIAASAIRQMVFDQDISAQIASDRKLVQQALGVTPSMAERLQARRASQPPDPAEPASSRLSM